MLQQEGAIFIVCFFGTVHTQETYDSPANLDSMRPLKTVIPLIQCAISAIMILWNPSQP